ncbi:MAG: endo-1,4-beta-xylanase [Alphaproteobacteria bacterium]|nr:endo-1,4-beta-xylanase [Alphaproteobacteria bacterium]
MNRRAALALPVVALPAQAQPNLAPLRQQARAFGRAFGAAIRSEILAQDADYARLFATEAEILVPEWEGKWEALQPTEGTFDLAPLRSIITAAHGHHQRVRGHALVWHNAMPEWLPRRLADGASAARAALETHFNTILPATRQAIRDWDVINEPIANAPGADNPQAGPNPLRESPWFRALGPDYIEHALRLARSLDPTLRLTLNEYGIEEATPDAEIKRNRLLALLRRLLDRGTPLDALGIQAHLQLRRPFDAQHFGRFLAEIRSMGLAIIITELDVREADQLPPDITARDNAVAQRVREFCSTATQAGCRTIITWGLTDRHSWLTQDRDVARRDNIPTRGLPFDTELRRKPMWHALAGVLSG